MDNSFLCLGDIKNNSILTQKKKNQVEGNVKICLPAVLRILILTVAQCMQCDHNVEMCLKILFSYQLNHAIICRCSTDQDI